MATRKASPDELPADFQFPDELPADFNFPDHNAAGEVLADPNTTIPAEVVPQVQASTPWYEGLFPRSSAASDLPAYSPRALSAAALDVASLPLRANAALVRPSSESYMDALARTTARPDAQGVYAVTDAINRDPATLAMAALPGGIPAWAARAGWLARGVAAGIPQAVALAGSRQAENVAAGRSMSAGESAVDIGAGLGFGLGGELASLAGRGMKGMAKRGMQQIVKPGTAKQGQEINDFRRALDAGLLPEMAGWGTLTAQGAGQRFGERLAAKELAYPRVLAAADATGQRVSVGGALNRAKGDVAEQMATGRLPASANEAQDALGWVAERAAIPDDPALVNALLSGEAPSSALTLMPSVAQARKSALWNEAFKDPTKSTARGSATKATARGMAEELGKISPQLAALNAEMAPWYAAAPAMIRAAGPRGNAYGFGPMELLGFGAGAGIGGSQEGLGGGAGAGIGGALAVRALRSPAAMRALYDAGRASIAASPVVRRLAPLATVATDNARGRK